MPTLTHHPCQVPARDCVHAAFLMVIAAQITKYMININCLNNFQGLDKKRAQRNGVDSRLAARLLM